MAKLDPRVSEFESTEAADYDWWFRAKIERA
ncbi:antitoxin, partial [Xanthomonas oryzae pv. oryzae]